MAEVRRIMATYLCTIEVFRNIHWNLSVEKLVELAVSRGEGVYSAHKALVTNQKRTGRSPNDKFIVDEPPMFCDVNWGDVNVSTDMATFTKMRSKVIDYLSVSGRLVCSRPVLRCR